MTHLTFGDLERETERFVASVKALEPYQLSGIKNGAVDRLVKAALDLTQGAERLHSWWAAHRGKPLPFQLLSGISEPARRILEARAELSVRHAEGTGPTAGKIVDSTNPLVTRVGARLPGNRQQRERRR